MSLQFTELNQLDQTGSFGQTGLTELFAWTNRALSGQAEDWVWSTTSLLNWKGSKPVEQQDISLEATMQEFNQMVHQAQPSIHHTEEIEVEQPDVPAWSYLISPNHCIGHFTIHVLFLQSITCTLIK